MKKTFFMVMVLLFTGIANADISNTQCSSSKNEITYNHTGLYNHVWLYVNNIFVDDFWTLSSGSGVYKTDLTSGDFVAMYFYNGNNHGYDGSSCN